MIQLINADAVKIPLADESVNLVVTSPPYWGLRSYEGNQALVWGGVAGCSHLWGEEEVTVAPDNTKHKGKKVHKDEYSSPFRRGLAYIDQPGFKPAQGQFCQLCGAWRGAFGLEPTPDLFIEHLVTVFREVHRVLHPSGLCFVNLGDSYANVGKWGGSTGGKHVSELHGNNGPGRSKRDYGNLKPKDLCLIPQRAALAFQANGWWVRSFMPWPKGNALPESVRDRPTTSHEYWIMLAKRKRYFWDGNAVRVGHKYDGRQITTVQDVKRKDTELAWQPGPRERWPNAAGRNRRTSDTWLDGLDVMIAEQRRYLAHLEAIRDGTGILLAQDGEPAALRFNTAGYSGAHFATFPPKMIAPLIEAGSSELGVCSVCREPWIRVIKRTGHVNKRERAHVPGNCTTKTDSTGWKPLTRVTSKRKPNCSCNAPAIPALVCDPFVGSGTTLQVARALGRDAIGFDLSFPYLAEQARTRLSLAALDAWKNGRADSDGEGLEELPLFAGVIL